MKNNLFIIISQISSSLSSFLLSIYILKLCTSEDFGNYTIIISLFFFSISIFNALISTPLLIEKGKFGDGIISQFFKFTMVYIGLVQVPILILLYYLNIPYFYLVPPFLILIVITKEFFKTVTIWKSDNKRYAFMDIFYLVMITVFCTIGYFLGLNDIVYIYFIICASHIVSIIPYAILFKNKIYSTSPSDYSYKDEWRNIKDSLFGVFVTEINSRGYIYFISVFFGKEILALINAPRLFTNPINSVSYAYVRFLKPKIAAQINSGNTKKAIDVTFKSYGILIFVILALLACIYLLKDYMLDFVFSNFDKDNVMLMFYVWSGVLFIQVANMFTSSILQVMKKFRFILRTSQFAACIIAIGLTIIYGFSLSYYYLPLLLVVSEFIMLLRNSRMLLRYKKTSESDIYE
ncbi:hypothetical protein ACXJY6_14580 [Vibrio sp. RC27]